MNNVHQFRTEEQIYEEASLWVARLDRSLTEPEQQELRRWLALSTRHRECLLETAGLWDRMDSLSMLAELFDPPAAQPVARSTGRRVWAMAAAVAAMALGLTLLVREPATDVPGAVLVAGVETAETLYETGIGAHSTVNLPDGTRLLLNTNTQVAVSYTPSQRLLVLKRGELHVEVAHDPQRPLRVQVGDKVVEAVGTAFNVYLKDDQSFDVIVTEGRVQVKSATETPSVTPAQSPVPVQELVQGQRLSVRASRVVEVQEIAPSAIQDQLSWRDGNLVFRGETLAVALDELSRYTADQFKVLDPRISEVRIAGLYKAGDIDGLLTALRENFNIDHQRRADGTIELSFIQ